MYMLDNDDDIFASSYQLDEEEEDEVNISKDGKRYQTDKEKHYAYDEFEPDKAQTNYFKQEIDKYREDNSKKENYSSQITDISNMKYPKLGSKLHEALNFLNDSLDTTNSFKNFNWTKQYEKVMAQKDSIEKYAKISELAKDFNYTAKLYGQIIINELCLPNAQKTIKPVDIGGIAGGSKYIVCGILFKFSLDNYGVYNYNDEGAMKAAAHELRGVLQLHSNSPLLTPLMCLIDYKGFRLIAMSLLKIDKSSLVYGSADGGETVFNEDEKVSKEMEKVAQLLNLKKHTVKDKNLFVCGDIEIHKVNQKIYALDAARLFPPEARSKEISSPRGVWLYELLRPELVKKFSKPLSSDAFSSFQRFDEDKKEHNNDVIEATNMMMEKCVPKVAEIVNDLEKELKTRNLAQILHENGVNIRKIGFVRSLVENTWTKKWILQYCFVRGLKSFLQYQMRFLMWKMKVPRDEVFKNVLVDLLNLVFGNIDQNRSIIFWKSFREIIDEKFPKLLTEEEKDEKFSLHKTFSAKHFLQIWKILLPHFRFTKDIRQATKYFKKTLHETIFVLGDIEIILPKLKQMDITYSAEANNLVLIKNNLSDRENSSEKSTSRLRKLALKVLNSSIEVNSNNFSVLLQHSILLIETSRFETGVQSIKKALLSLQSAFLLQPKNAQVHFYFAIAYLQLLFYSNSNSDNKLEKAAKYLQTAFEIEKKSINRLIKFQIPLRSKGNLPLNNEDIIMIFFILSGSSLVCKYFLNKYQKNNNKFLFDINFYSQLLLTDQILLNLIDFGLLNKAKKINLSGCKKLSINSLEKLSKLPNLEELNLTNISKNHFSIEFYQLFFKLKKLMINGEINEEIIKFGPKNLNSINGNLLIEFPKVAESLMSFGPSRNKFIFVSTNDPNLVFCCSLIDGKLVLKSSINISKEGDGPYIIGSFGPNRVITQVGNYLYNLSFDEKTCEMKIIFSPKSNQLSNTENFLINDQEFYSVGNWITQWNLKNGSAKLNLKFPGENISNFKMDDFIGKGFATTDNHSFIVDLQGKKEKIVKERVAYINDLVLSDDNFIIATDDKKNSIRVYSKHNAELFSTFTVASPDCLFYDKPFLYVVNSEEIGVYNEIGKKEYSFPNLHNKRIYSKHIFMFNGILCSISSVKSCEFLQLHCHVDILAVVAMYSKEVISAYLDRFPSSLHARDYRGYTPLHVACRRYDVDIINLLCDRKADPSLLSIDKKTAFGIVSDEFTNRCLKLGALDNCDIQLTVALERLTDPVLIKMEEYCKKSYEYKTQLDLLLESLSF